MAVQPQRDRVMDRGAESLRASKRDGGAGVRLIEHVIFQRPQQAQAKEAAMNLFCTNLRSSRPPDDAGYAHMEMQ